MAKMIRADAPATYICVGGKMVPVLATKADKNGNITKYHADVSKAIDKSNPDAEIALMKKENLDLQRKVEALAEALEEIRQSGEPKNKKKPS